MIVVVIVGLFLVLLLQAVRYVRASSLRGNFSKDKNEYWRITEQLKDITAVMTLSATALSILLVFKANAPLSGILMLAAAIVFRREYGKIAYQLYERK